MDITQVPVLFHSLFCLFMSILFENSALEMLYLQCVVNLPV